MFVRFIDNYILLVVGYETGIAFMELLTSRRPNIKVMFKISNKEAQFLDLTLYKTECDPISVKTYKTNEQTSIHSTKHLPSSTYI